MNDLRTAAEIMTDALVRQRAEDLGASLAIPLMGPRVVGNYIDEFVDGKVWHSYLGEPVGPTARQVFNAAVMCEQVDPQ